VTLTGTAGGVYNEQDGEVWDGNLPLSQGNRSFSFLLDGIGQTMTEDEQTPSDSSVVNEDANPSDTQSGNQEDVVPLGDNVTAGNFTDFGASGEGFDVGGGDLGGSESW
jgi:hypothetical protein